MPPRLLLPLALLGALALAWFLLSSGDDAPPPSELTTDEFDEHGEHAPTMTAKGRPAGTSRRTPRSAPARPSALAIGEPRPERVQVTLRGRVQGRDGRPVAGARVQVFGRDGQPIELVTASDGTFQFRGVPGRYRVLVDGGRDGVAWSSELVLDGNPAARPATLALQEVGTLSVTVSTPAGPAAGTVVQLTAP
ncbi:MAG: carboxypeptidase-like regulatory domain-containing protein, partial [Planctomycetota bacterium]|nr:carboxypeptidase-like regulatory domain-containing protein [Planctomycetota bacterium]